MTVGDQEDEQAFREMLHGWWSSFPQPGLPGTPAGTVEVDVEKQLRYAWEAGLRRGEEKRGKPAWSDPWLPLLESGSAQGEHTGVSRAAMSTRAALALVREQMESHV